MAKNNKKCWNQTSLDFQDSELQSLSKKTDQLQQELEYALSLVKITFKVK